jgi:hypothetical protein
MEDKKIKISFGWLPDWVHVLKPGDAIELRTDGAPVTWEEMPMICEGPIDQCDPAEEEESARRALEYCEQFEALTAFTKKHKLEGDRRPQWLDSDFPEYAPFSEYGSGGELDKELAVLQKRLKDGVCLVCADRGEMRAGACMCSKGHGKVWG